MTTYQYHIHFIKDKNQQVVEVEDVVIEASCFDEVYEKIKKSKSFFPNLEILHISRL